MRQRPPLRGTAGLHRICPLIRPFGAPFPEVKVRAEGAMVTNEMGWSRTRPYGTKRDTTVPYRRGGHPPPLATDLRLPFSGFSGRIR